MSNYICFIKRIEIRTNGVFKTLLLAIVCVLLFVAGCRNKNRMDSSQLPQTTTIVPTPSGDINNKNKVEPSQRPLTTAVAPTSSGDINNESNIEPSQPPMLISSDGNYQYYDNVDSWYLGENSIYDGDTANVSSLMRYVGSGGDVVIPKEIDGLPVTVIGSLGGGDDVAFAGCTNITSVTIPEGVVIIQSDAFRDCTNLIQVNIPASVRFIGNCAFSGCPNLQSVYFAGDAPKTGNYVFQRYFPDILTIYYHSGTKGWKKQWNGCQKKKY